VQRFRLPSPGVLFIHSTVDGDPLTPLHPNYVKLVRTGWLILAVPLLIGGVLLETTRSLPTGAFLVPAVLAALYAVLRMPRRRYRTRGYQLGEDRLRVVRGVLTRRDTVVPFGRVQHIDVLQGALERSYGLSTLVLHTAGTHNASVSLPGLGRDDALAMREAIRAHVKRETM
jgi:membrane protein YdbS with pleckstrin-like domain